MIIPHAKSSTLPGRTLTDPRPKPAKELSLPSHGLIGIKHETLTRYIKHLADSADIKGGTFNKLCNGLIGSRFEMPNVSYTHPLAVIIKKMTKGIIGGMTDYSHQSFNDIVEDLLKEYENISSFINLIEENLVKSQSGGYWKLKVPFNFKSIVSYSLKHFKTTQEELQEIANEIQIEVREHHYKRLQLIATVADEININIGKVWHQEYDGKEYGNSDFEIVEDIYGDIRDMAVNLLDISNIASRLHDFIGKTKITMENKTNNSGFSGNVIGDNFSGNTIIIGDHNQVKTIQIQNGNFDSLRELLERNNVSSEDIEELKEIVTTEEPNVETKTLGTKANGWIAKMVNKCLDGSWAIGIGAAGKLLADGIKAYYGWNI